MSPERRRTPWLLVGVTILAVFATAALVLTWGRPQPADAPTSARIDSWPVAMEAMPSAHGLLATALSYDHASFDDTVEAAAAVMTDPYQERYRTTMAQNRARILADRIVNTAQVVELGVVSQTPDAITLLAFVDQRITEGASDSEDPADPEDPDGADDPGSTGARRTDQTRLEVVIVRDGAEWRISNIEPV